MLLPVPKIRTLETSNRIRYITQAVARRKIEYAKRSGDIETIVCPPGAYTG